MKLIFGERKGTRTFKDDTVKQRDNIFCVQQSVAQQQFEAAQILYETIKIVLM